MKVLVVYHSEDGHVTNAQGKRVAEVTLAVRKDR